MELVRSFTKEEKILREGAKEDFFGMVARMGELCWRQKLRKWLKEGVGIPVSFIG